MRTSIWFLLLAITATGCVRQHYLHPVGQAYDDPDEVFDRRIDLDGLSIYLPDRSFCGTETSIVVAIKNNSEQAVEIDPGEIYLQRGDERIYHVTHATTEVVGSAHEVKHILRPQSIPPGIRIRGNLVFPVCYHRAEAYVLDLWGKQVVFERRVDKTLTAIIWGIPVFTGVAMTALLLILL